MPPADAYGVATFYALFSRRAAPAARRARLRRHRLPLQRRRRADRRSSRSGSARRDGLDADGAATWLRSPCLGQCDRRPGGAPRRSPGSAPRSACSRPSAPRRCSRALDGRRGRGPTPRPRRPQARRAVAALLARVGRVDPASLDDYRAHGGYAALRRALELGPRGRHPRAQRLAPRRARRRGVPDGRKWEAVARQPARPHYLVCNADESEPGTFKDRVHHRGRPVRADRGDDDRRLRDRLRARLRLPARRVSAGARHARRGARRGAARAASSATTCSATGSRSTSRSARAPAPTSAARRRRSSTRSRGSAASRATSRRSRCRTASSASRPSSTTSRRSSTCSAIVLDGAARLRRDRHRGLDRHEAVLPLRQRRAPGRLRGRRSARRSASCSSSRAASRAGARCRRS